MELHRLPVDAAMQRDPVDSGWARAIYRGPRTIGQVLAAAAAEMDAEDERLEQARDPVGWVRAHRPRRLIDRLLGRPS
jgi:hypothetical protein